MSRIYLAASWRNPYHSHILGLLRGWQNEVYDFKNPKYATGFAWSEVGMDRQPTAKEYVYILNNNPRCAQGFMSDIHAMQWADTCVMLLPSGRSAHLELGWMAGRGKRTIIYTRDGEEPELMALMADHIVTDDEELMEALR